MYVEIGLSVDGADYHHRGYYDTIDEAIEFLIDLKEELSRCSDLKGENK